MDVALRLNTSMYMTHSSFLALMMLPAQPPSLSLARFLISIQKGLYWPEKTYVYIAKGTGEQNIQIEMMHVQ